MDENLAPIPASREYCLALQRLLARPTNPKLGLSRISNLLAIIGFDRRSMRIVQVVGTNGKGSTVAFMESLLRAHGLGCGLFTSPHLCTARERIRINGSLVSEDDFVDAANHVLEGAQKLDDEASFFECVFAMALWLFQKYRLDYAVLEAGLGGRLDATTAALADVLGISSIDRDHQAILGETVAAIAREKIHAARTHQSVITVPQSPEAMASIRCEAKSIGCIVEEAKPCMLPLGLYGCHQQINAGLALALVRAIIPTVDDHAIERGMLMVNWPGRFELVRRSVPIVLDGAHNPAGMQSLVDALKTHEDFAHRPLWIVYGSLDGSNVHDKINVLSKGGLAIQGVYLHQPRNPRALTAQTLRETFLAHGFAESVMHDYLAMEALHNEAALHDTAIVVCGSLYTIGEIRSELFGIPMDDRCPSF